MAKSFIILTTKKPTNKTKLTSETHDIGDSNQQKTNYYFITNKGREEAIKVARHLPFKGLTPLFYMALIL